MKRPLCLFLALAAALSLFTVSLAEEPEEIPGTVEVPYAGFRFVPPEAYRNTKGTVSFVRVIEDAEDICYAIWNYYAMTEEELEAYLDRDNKTAADPDNPQAPKDISLFILFSIGHGMTFDRYNALSGNYWTEEDHITEIGKAGDTTFYITWYDEPSEYFAEEIDPEYVEDYKAVTAALEDAVKGFTFYEPQKKRDIYADLRKTPLTFTGTDLNGNPVSAPDIFAGSRITLVNVWATWCGPCEGELEDLQSIYTRYQDKGVNVVGFMYDDDVEAAREILVEHRVTYPIVLISEDVADTMLVNGFPSSYFYGEAGTMIADPIIGPYTEKIITTINTLLRCK